jgi:hypothetical protein
VALIVEDGTGLSNSESYISVADADTRHTNLGNTAWTAGTVTTTQKEAALRKATNYMLQVFRDRWTGYRVKVNPMQALDWPRYGVEVDHFPVHFDIVPADVANACADLALKALSADLAPDLTQAVVREKVGPIETEYQRGSPQFTRYRAIELMLSPYLGPGAGMARLVRS